MMEYRKIPNGLKSDFFYIKMCGICLLKYQEMLVENKQELFYSIVCIHIHCFILYKEVH